MRSKFIILITFFILFFCLFISFFSTCNASDQDYIISLEDTSWKLVKTTEKAGQTFTYYDIVVILYNSGSVESDNITVQLQDDMGNYSIEEIIGPGEYKTYTFNEHPLLGTGKQTLTINFFPSIFEKRNQYNTGSSYITVQGNSGKQDAKGMPGFEFYLFLSVIGLLLIIVRLEQKKTH